MNYPLTSDGKDKMINDLLKEIQEQKQKLESLEKKHEKMSLAKHKYHNKYLECISKTVEGDRKDV